MNFETNIEETIFAETEFPVTDQTEFTDLETLSPFMNSETGNGFYREISFSEYEAAKKSWTEAIRQNKYYAKSIGWDKDIEKIRNYLIKYLGLTNVIFTDDIFAKSVSEWQSRIKAGLTADGVIGPKSWAVLKPLLAGTPVSPPVQTVNTPSRWTSIIKDTVLCPAEPLLHGSDAYKKIVEAIRTADSASHYIYILGWMLDSNFEMVPGDPGSTLYNLLSRANEKGVEIRILIWNNFFYKDEIAAAIDKINKLPNALMIRDNFTYGSTGLKNAISKLRYLINSAPIALNLLDSWKDFKEKVNIIQNEGSHHEKVVVVKGREGLIAFCGGIDINPDRVWKIENGKSAVLHDVHCMVKGYAAYVLLHRFKCRWQVLRESLYWMPLLKNSINEPVPGAISGSGSAHVKILQTYNHPSKIIKDRTIRETVRTAIANARTSIHFEDQYMISLEIASWVNTKLKEPGFQRVTILTQDDSYAKPDIQFPKDMRKKFIDYLCRGLTPDQIRTKVFIQMLHPDSPPLSHHKVHSKIYIIDDELAIIGSANCSSRSMTHDSETAAVIFSDPGTDNFVSKLRSKMNYDPLQNIIPYSANPNVKDKDVELRDDINNFASKASIVTGIVAPALPVSLILNSLIPALKPAFIDIIDPDADDTVPQQELSEEYELKTDNASGSFEFHDSGLNKSLSETEYYESTEQYETGNTKVQESYEYAKYEDISNSIAETASERINNGVSDEFSIEYEQNKWSHAVIRNRYHSKELGWDKFINQINDFLLPFSGLQNVSLGEELFAQSVAEWQRRQGFSLRDTDGIIGPKTWQIMRSHIPGAGAQQTGTNQNIKTVTSGLPAWVKTLTPLLNKYRGDIPLDFLLGWIAVESYGKIDVTTSLNERGYFQIHPDESKMLKITDHNRLSTDPEFSISGGISLIRNRGIQAGKIADSIGFAKGSDLYWHIVKLLHWLPGGVKIITDEMISQGFRPSDWDEYKNFVIRNQEKIKQTMRNRFGKVWDPLKGLANVDKLYNYANQFKQNLQTNEFEDEYEIQPDINYYDIPYFKNLKPDGVFKARRLIDNITDTVTGKKPWSFLFELMKFTVTEYFNALQFGEQISCLKGISYAIVARTIGEIPPQPSRNWPLSQQKAYIDGAAFVGNFMKKGLNISPYDGITAATKETDVNIVFGLLGAQLYKSKAGSPWYMIRSITGSLKWPKDNILLYEMEEYNESEYQNEMDTDSEYFESDEAGIYHSDHEISYEDVYSAAETESPESFLGYEAVSEESENHTETIDEPDYNVKEYSVEQNYTSEFETAYEANYTDYTAGSRKPRGSDIYETGAKHAGEQYIFGALVPKNNSNWKGPWDCAEFASWCVYQVSGILYGCENNSGNPATANSYTGYWGRDANSLGKKISVEEAARTPGAAVLRLSTPTSSTGHIVISDGKGGTIEAHSTSSGVIKSTLSNRRWDMGILVPGIEYQQDSSPVIITNPTETIYRLTNPMMKGDMIKEIQTRLKSKGFDPGVIDGVFGLKTYNAVRAFQLSAGLVVDGEAGPAVLKALGIGSSAPPQPTGPVYTNPPTSVPSVQNIFEFNKWHAQKIIDNMNSGIIGQYFDSKSQLEKIARGETVLYVDPKSRIIQALPIIYHISEQAKLNNYRDIFIGSFIRGKSTDGSCTGHCEGRCIDINYKGGSFESSGSAKMVINILRYLISLSALYKKSMGFGMPLQGEFFGNKNLAKFKSQPASMLINNDLKQLVPQLGYVFPDNNNHLHIQVKWT